MHTVEMRNTNGLMTIIEKGTSVNKQNNNKQSIWSFICELGNTEVINYMLKHGLGINTADADGQINVWWTIHRSHLNAVQYLISQKVSLKSY